MTKIQIKFLSGGLAKVCSVVGKKKSIGERDRKVPPWQSGSRELRSSLSKYWACDLAMLKGRSGLKVAD